jgi:hypothetical protein
MTWFRHLLLRPHAAALLLVATLLMKMLVPAGFMPMAEQGSLRIMPCSGYAPQPQIPMASGHGGHHGEHGPQQRHHQNAQKMPCDFSVLAGPSLAGGEPIALEKPLTLAAMVAAAPPLAVDVALPTYLRPPLRGPPSA